MKLNHMNIIVSIIMGLIAGWLASVIMKTNSTQGPIMDIVLGMLGALVGSFLLSIFGAPGVTGFNLYSILVSVIGAIVLIAIGRAVRT